MSVIWPPRDSGGGVVASRPGGPAGPQGPASISTVTVTGVGEVSVAPDALSLELSVEARAAGVATALSTARAAMAEVRRVVSAAGVEEADQRTSGLHIWANHHEDTGAQNGFRAIESLTVLLRQPELVDVVLVGAAEAAGDLLRVGGLSFTVTEPSEAQDEARRLALAEARRRAELYATELGRPLGRLRRLVEGRGGGEMLEAASSARRHSKSMEPGTQIISIQVSAEWEIEQRRRPADDQV